MDLEGKRVAILGMGVSGQAAAQLLLNRGAKPFGIDRKSDLLSQLSLPIDSYLEEELTLLPLCDLLVVSPGVPDRHPLRIQAKQRGIEVIGEIELACRYLKQRCVGVTGTNGKTTTTLMATHALNQQEIEAIAAGNVGVPLSALVDDPKVKPETLIILELSSYQLETLQTAILEIGLVLNITPNHLDRHKSMDAYARAKLRMASCLKQNGEFWIDREVASSFGALLTNHPYHVFGYRSSSAGQIAFLDNREPFTLPLESQLIDRHNRLSAFVICQKYGMESDTFFSSLETFKKPPHRIEFVAKIGGVSYYNDSKASNTQAVISALAAFEKEKILLIAGGVDKGGDYYCWIDPFRDKVVHLYLIGEAAKKIENQLRGVIPITFCGSLAEAVQHTSERAKGGEVVLLSPGCSSFDQFKSYEHRGDVFKYLVTCLERERIV